MSNLRIVASARRHPDRSLLTWIPWLTTYDGRKRLSAWKPSQTYGADGLSTRRDAVEVAVLYARRESLRHDPPMPWESAP